MGGLTETSRGLEEIFLKWNKNQIAARVVTVVCLSHFRKMAAKLLTLEMNSSPLFTVSTWTVCFSSHACMHTIAGRKKKFKQLPNPEFVNQRGRKVKEAWKDTPRAGLSVSWLLSASRALEIFWSSL